MTYAKIHEIIKNPRVSDLDRRRFAIWCAEQVARYCRFEPSLKAFEVAKRHVEGTATAEEMEAAWQAAESAWPLDYKRRKAFETSADLAASALQCTALRHADLGALSAARDSRMVIVLMRVRKNCTDEEWDTEMEKEEIVQMEWLNRNVSVTARKQRKAKGTK